MYLLRLDDASENMMLDNWMRMKKLLDKYDVKPIFGIIPDNKDPELLKYDKVTDFWKMMNQWQNEGWIPAMHGCNHVFETIEGGINPVNRKSEFAGVPLERQREKLRKGYKIITDYGIITDVFFAPAHTFDENTLKAIYLETDIKIISDTVANDIYYNEPFYYIPQQSGRVRKLPFKTVTFCYHPNTMMDKDFIELNSFMKKHKNQFNNIDFTHLSKRRKGIFDKMMETIYFNRHIVKCVVEKGKHK